jgi:hypothetical protein
VINSSAGSKVRSSVRALEIVAAVTAILTALYWWNTRPRRRVAVAAARAQERAELTSDAGEIYASALAGSSVFEVETGQNPAVVSVNNSNGNGDRPAPDLPLAARLPRALTASGAAASSESTTEPAVEAEPLHDATVHARPNPRPTPRRHRAHLRSHRGVDAGAVETDE